MPHRPLAYVADASCAAARSKPTRSVDLIPPGPEDLFATAQELLDAAYAGTVASPGGPIEYRAVSPGPPSYDCIPALYVHAGVNQMADTYPLQPPLQPMQRIVTTGYVDLVSFTITVLRCGPVMSGQSRALPSPAQISASAREMYGDLWAIWNTLKNMHRDGTLFQSPSKRREFILDPSVPIRQQGGAVGWEIAVKVQLGGYS